MSYATIEVSREELLELLEALRKEMAFNVNTEECADALEACIEDFRKFMPNWYRPDLRILSDQKNAEIMFESLPAEAEKEFLKECAGRYLEDADEREFNIFIEDYLNEDCLESMLETAVREARKGGFDKWRLQDLLDRTETLRVIKEAV